MSRRHVAIRRDVGPVDTTSEAFVDEFREALCDSLPVGVGVVYVLAAPDQLVDAWRVMLRHVDDRNLLELPRTVTRAALTGGAITGEQHAKIVELLA